MDFPVAHDRLVAVVTSAMPAQSPPAKAAVTGFSLHPHLILRREERGLDVLPVALPRLGEKPCGAFQTARKLGRKKGRIPKKSGLGKKDPEGSCGCLVLLDGLVFSPLRVIDNSSDYSAKDNQGQIVVGHFFPSLSRLNP